MKDLSIPQVTLYHYIHCPYCIRVRMALGYLQIAYKSNLLHYADESTPIKCTGKKMAPFISYLANDDLHQGNLQGNPANSAPLKFMNESLNIIEFLDQKNILKTKEFKLNQTEHPVELFLQKISPDLFNLCMPYYAFSHEFNDEDRIYFRAKKELKRGPLKILASKKDYFATKVMEHIEGLVLKSKPFLNGRELVIDDIVLASHLWGLYLVPEFRMKDDLHEYLQAVKQQCHFCYEEQLWD